MRRRRRRNCRNDGGVQVTGLDCSRFDAEATEFLVFFNPRLWFVYERGSKPFFLPFRSVRQNGSECVKGDSVVQNNGMASRSRLVGKRSCVVGIRSLRGPLGF